MTPWKLAGTTAILALISANAALADVTPEEVWQNWQDLYSASGATVTTGSVARDGDALVITDLKSSTDGVTGKAEIALAEMRLLDAGDGTVTVTVAEEMVFSSSSPGIDDGPAMAASGVIKMPGLTGKVSGTAAEMAYALTAPSIEIKMEPTEDGMPAGKVDMVLSNTTSTYQLTGPADAKVLDGGFAAATIALNMAVNDKADSVTGTFNAADISGKISGTFAGMDDKDLADALDKGFAIDTSLTYGVMLYDFETTGEDAPAKLTGGSEGGSFQVALSAAQMVLAAGGKNVSLTFSGGNLPVPEVQVSYAESAVNLTLPVSKSDEPKDFSFLLKMVDLQVSDTLWGMIDPTGAVPHDPATVVIDTVGTAKMNRNVMATTESGNADGEMHSLEVKELRASAAGAELTGTGAFTFDNSDMTTYDGMPAPTGKLDLKLVGGNALLDKLVALGVVSQDEAMGARMMVAMFAKSNGGGDELTSQLEFKDKHFYANGQQLQ